MGALDLHVGRVGGSGGGIGGSSAGGRGAGREAGWSEAGGSLEASIHAPGRVGTPGGLTPARKSVIGGDTALRNKANGEELVDKGMGGEIFSDLAHKSRSSPQKENLVLPPNGPRESWISGLLGNIQAVGIG